MTTPYSPEDVKRYLELVKQFEDAHEEMQGCTIYHPQFSLICGKRHALWFEIEALKNQHGGKAPEPEGK